MMPTMSSELYVFHGCVRYGAIVYVIFALCRCRDLRSLSHRLDPAFYNPQPNPIRGFMEERFTISAVPWHIARAAVPMLDLRVAVANVRQSSDTFAIAARYIGQLGRKP